MPERISRGAERQSSISVADSSGMTALLPSDFEQLIEEARPRLLRSAQMNGVVPDARDDVVQETLLEAWRHLDQFHAPWHFDAWLNGICRNVCRRHAHVYMREVQQQTLLSQSCLLDYDGNEYEGNNDIPDLLTLDPVEELYHDDLVLFLERALGYISSNAREALELCYLAEIPQQEAALRLEISTHALEMRLLRGRRELRRVLSGALRVEAETFDLVMEPDTTGWRETREWCCHCGRNRLSGIFERQEDGRMNLRMRCPACSPQLGDMISTQGLIPIKGLHSFRPALKCVYATLRHFYREALVNRGKQRCLICGQWMQVISPDYAASNVSHHYQLIYDCPNCSLYWHADVVSACWIHPSIQSFLMQHRRSFVEPEKVVEYENQLAIRFSLQDVANASRLTVLTLPQTLEVLTTFQE